MAGKPTKKQSRSKTRRRPLPSHHELAARVNAATAEHARQRKLVPDIGEPGARRWYDYPYRALEAVTFNAPWKRRVPPRVRSSVNALMNQLMAFNQRDRARVAYTDNPLHNLFVPDGEQVNIPAFCLVDYYAPSHVDTLRRRLGKAKWNRDITRPYDAPEVSLMQGRQHDERLTWEELARFYNRNHRAEHHSIFGIRAALPNEIRDAAAYLYPLATGLTAIVIEFHLTEDARTLLNDAMQADHPPQLFWTKGRLRVRDRVDVGFAQVAAAREKLHDAARQWMSAEVPGVFAQSPEMKQTALDVILTSAHDPSSDDYDRENTNYLRSLGILGIPGYRTIIEDLPGVSVLEYTPEAIKHRGDAGWTLVAQESTAKEFIRASHRPDGDIGAIGSEMIRAGRGLLTRLGLYTLLDMKQSELSVARDTAHRLHSRRPVHGAKKLRRSVLRDSLDLSSIVDGVIALTSDQSKYDWPLPKLRNARINDQDQRGDSVSTGWATRQREWAGKLRQLDDNQLRVLGLTTSLASSIDGIRSQRWGLAVSALSFVSSVLAVWLAYLALSGP
ncbi:hypothetical protein LJR186_000877 [Microbacterium foliorum]